MSVQAGAPAGEWLLVIDMQRVFAEPGGPWFVPGFATILPTVDALIARYAPHVVLTRYVAPLPPPGAWRAYFAGHASLLLAADAAEWDLVTAHAGDARIATRATFAKWDGAIRELVGPDGCIAVCGVATECCVLATVLRAIDDGVGVRVLADACAGVTAELHRQALAILATFAPLVRIATAAG